MIRTALLTLALLLPSLSTLADDARFYEVQKTEPKVAVGAKGKATVTVAGKNGWHINAEAPITLTLTPDAGLTVEKQKLTRLDLALSTKDAARFEILLSAAEPGLKALKAEARFVMCQATACRPAKETVALNVDVTPAAAPTAAAKPGKPAKAKGKTAQP